MKHWVTFVSKAMVGEIAIKIALQEAIKTTLKFFKERKLKVNTTARDVEIAISNHINELHNWSKEISFSDLKKSKLTSQVFIDIDIFLMPKKSRISSDENIAKISCRELFSDIKTHCVILGQPGAGKTTLMKFLCQSVLFDEKFYPNEFKIPIIVRLRELNAKAEKAERDIIINSLFDTLGLSIQKEKADMTIKDEDLQIAKERLLIPILENLNLLIILDGYDELSMQKLKDRVIEDFKKLVLNLRAGKILLTSRSSDYSYSIENTSVLEICPLNQMQIKNFALKWIGDQEGVDNFLNNLNASPFVDTAIRPLTLSHLCAIYERVGKIPDKPKTVYKKIVNLLLEEWDEQRAVKRSSQYGNFEVDRKFEFLCGLAFLITIAFHKSVFTEVELKMAYKDLCVDFGLRGDEVNQVIKELEGHTGLIVQSGYKDYEFSHKSIHEYLCAEHLVKLPTIPVNDEVLFLLPNELAIATTISSNPSMYFYELVLNRFYSKRTGFKNSSPNLNFMTTFVNRLVLEKPDFNFSEDVSFALVVLYTLLRRTDSGQMKLFEYELPTQFERFVELIFKRNTKFEFKKFYSLDEKYVAEDGEPILKLVRNNVDANYISLPPYLFAKKSFVAGFNKI